MVKKDDALGKIISPVPSGTVFISVVQRWHLGCPHSVYVHLSSSPRTSIQLFPHWQHIHRFIIVNCDVKEGIDWVDV